jgi:hypothetical protein
LRCLASSYFDDSYILTSEDLSGNGPRETLARGADLMVMRAAFDAAVVERQGRLVMLRHGTRIVRQSPEWTPRQTD